LEKILAISGSNSVNSINQQLLKYAVNSADDLNITKINLADFEAPIYSSKIEQEQGFTHSILELYELIKKYDAFIIAVPEHNGLMPAFFKNTMDWLSRVDRKFFSNKPIILLSTSPGAGGGRRGLEILKKFIGYFDGKVLGTFSLPLFYESFDKDKSKIINTQKADELNELFKEFKRQSFKIAV
jgi:NAD(P)H-dependent FMN reductase